MCSQRRVSIYRIIYITWSRCEVKNWYCSHVEINLITRLVLLLSLNTVFFVFWKSILILTINLTMRKINKTLRFLFPTKGEIFPCVQSNRASFLSVLEGCVSLHRVPQFWCTIRPRSCPSRRRMKRGWNTKMGWGSKTWGAPSKTGGIA